MLPHHPPYLVHLGYSLIGAPTVELHPVVGGQTARSMPAVMTSKGDLGAGALRLLDPPIECFQELLGKGDAGVLAAVVADAQLRTEALAHLTLPSPCGAVEDHHLADPLVAEALELLGAQQARTIDGKAGLRNGVEGLGVSVARRQQSDGGNRKTGGEPSARTRSDEMGAIDHLARP